MTWKKFSDIKNFTGLDDKFSERADSEPLDRVYFYPVETTPADFTRKGMLNGAKKRKENVLVTRKFLGENLFLKQIGHSENKIVR